MANGFKFTLLASKYTSRGKSFVKPFCTIVDENGLEELTYFRRCPEGTFEEELVTVATGIVHEETVSTVSKVKPSKEQSKPEPKSELEGISIDGLNGIPEPIQTILIEAGFTTVEKIMSDDVRFEDLTALKGIGEATANTIIGACEKATAEDFDNDNEE